MINLFIISIITITITVIVIKLIAVMDITVILIMVTVIVASVVDVIVVIAAKPYILKVLRSPATPLRCLSLCVYFRTAAAGVTAAGSNLHSGDNDHTNHEPSITPRMLTIVTNTTITGVLSAIMTRVTLLMARDCSGRRHADSLGEALDTAHTAHRRPLSQPARNNRGSV